MIRSDGSPERDFLYVEDVARAYAAIAEALAEGRGAGEAFNAGWGHPNAVREVVELICEIAGTEIEPDIRGEGNPAGEIDRQFLDSAKIREVTGWQPQVELRVGWAHARLVSRAPEARARRPAARADRPAAVAPRRGGSAPGRIRTCGLRLRRAALYQLSYGRSIDSRPV